MLRIQIPDKEFYDEISEEFIVIRGQTLELEHSLISLSKWESRWQVPFLSQQEKTREQTLSYVRDMTLTRNVDPTVYHALSDENLDAISAYIASPETATTFRNTPMKGQGSVVTAEIIYYWMISLTIPFECKTWHLNRLLTLIRVCNEKNAPKKKMSRAEQLQHQRNLNAQRRQARGSKG